MKSRFLLLTFLLLVAVAHMRAQAVESFRFSDLTLRIATTKPAYVLLEPVPLVFELKNNTGGPIRGSASFRFSCSGVKIFVRHPDGEVREVRLLSLFKARCISREGVISPQQAVQDTQILTLDLDRHFPVPGNYGIQAVAHDRSGTPETISSQWITISFHGTEGANHAAYEFLKEGIDVSRLYQLPETDEQRTYFEAFLANFSDSPYAPYIQYNLARYYVLVGDLEKANIKLEKLKSLKDFVLSPQVDELQNELERKRKLAQ